ncbi:MAG: hypothetical protein LBD16_03090 [Oscillospiraceae bacterium]|nr:hypothetical protein [Oscillospiraceae bacterium]
MNAKLNKLFGFRSGVPWKRGVALVYYLACAAFLIIGMLTPPLIPSGMRDAIVFKLSTFVIFLLLTSPAIFLSDTKIRRKLPLLRDNVGSKSLVGMMIVVVFLFYLFLMAEGLHSKEYAAEFRSFINETFDGFVEAGSAQ